MNDDKMRAEFEEWAKLELFDPLCPDANYLERDETSYFHTVADNYWIAWQAAYAAGQKSEREAIFIEWENGELLAAEVERLRGILQDVLDNDRFASLENARNLDDELKAQIVEAIGNTKEGE